MANMVKTETYGNRKNIMLSDISTVAFGVQVGNAGITADANGRKIIYAGTPLKGDIEKRDTAFVVSSDGTGLKGILLHDVDVTEGDANGSLVIFGFVDLNKLDAKAMTYVTAAAKTTLDGKITFLKGV